MWLVKNSKNYLTIASVNGRLNTTKISRAFSSSTYLDQCRVQTKLGQTKRDTKIVHRSPLQSNCREFHESVAEKYAVPQLMSLRSLSRKATFYDADFPQKGKRVDTNVSDGAANLREQVPRDAEDILFEMFRNEETQTLIMDEFLAALKATGIRLTDIRIREMMDNLKKVQESGSAKTQNLNRETFKDIISPNIVIIAQAFQQQFVVPDFSGFCKDIDEIYEKCKKNTEGEVASYIPELALFSPDLWGVSICTIDGQRYSIGNVDNPFTLQSCSKPLTYAIALEKLGPKTVHKYVGQEPSGRIFNEVILDYNKKPHNPMINAGAIVTCSLLQSLIKPEMALAEKFDYTLQWFKRMAGGENIGFNKDVFLSEREAADRNYALGFYMREHGCYPKKSNLTDVMDFYFQCCSMEANCEALSLIAATLANGGICPTTEEKVLRTAVVRDVLSIMHSCGTYDYSGQFAFKIGLPAKSGVCGGMLLVIPNIMGIFTWSPPLDKSGNSVRSVQFCEELIHIYNFHRYDNLKHATHKKDPCKHQYESKGLSIVNLLFSAASGDVTALRRHRLSAMDITLSDYDGRTALHLASSEGHLDCVQFLLEQCHAPYNPKDRWGNTPVDEAKNSGHTAIVEYLLAYAQRPDCKPDSDNKACKQVADADKEVPTSSATSDCDSSNTANIFPVAGIDGPSSKPGLKKKLTQIFSEIYKRKN